MITACAFQKKKNENPLLQTFDTPFQTPPFDKIKNEHFQPAIDAAIEEGRKEIDLIIDSKENPTFENTIVALDLAGKNLNRIASIFFNLNAAETSAELQKIAQQVSPMLSEYSNDIMLNEKLFERVKAVYDQKEILNLNTEQTSLLENTFKGFIRNGANLNEKDKKRFREISTELSKLSLDFQEHVLNETNAFELQVTSEEDLAGLPESVCEGAALTAKNKGKEGWIFTLQFPSYFPFMQYSEKRELREKLYRAYSRRGNKNNENDNKEIIRKIVNFRLEKARLLGYQTYSEYVLTERMAESPEKVNHFLEKLHAASRPHAEKEYKAISDYAQKNGADFKLQRWDWSYYAEKLKQEKYNLSDEMTKPYFKLENVTKGVFDLAHRLYGLKFVENNEIPVYHKDVKTVEVFDERNRFMGVLFLDFFPRESKRNGAWMTEYRGQSNVNGNEIRPLISVVMNFTKPTETKPSLLTFNEVETFLHEFGHALHGLLSNITYSSLSGTNVYRDFVELPSQILENWAVEKEWLDLFAVHYQTGKKMPEELINKIIEARNYNAGYSSERQLSFGMMDMAWHSIEEPFEGDIIEFEKTATAKTELFDQVEGSSICTAFSHIFSGGYATGYYGYKWAEVLDADAFAAFKENGIFDKETAKSFRENILSKGGSAHPMELYKKFRGQEPSEDALLIRSGLK